MKRIDLKRTHVARSNTVRDINRRIILNYVRENAPISRSDLAKKTALQRSTVSLIVKELKSLGLIQETYGESSGGRPPILLEIQALKPIALGIVVTTETTLIVTGDLSARIIDREEFPTDKDLDKTMARILEVARKLIKKNGNSIEGVGIVMPGVVDFNEGFVHFIPHFKWRDFPVTEFLGNELGLPVKAENDANAVALAELWLSQQSELGENRDFIAILVEEGIGTGVVFDGQVYQGKGGTAGEFGHMTIGSGAPVRCATGSRECWEAFASERAIQARYSSATDGKLLDVTAIFDLALEGDETAIAVIKENAHYLGIGIANIIQAMGPESVIVAGKITAVWELIEEDLVKAVESCICREYHSTRLIRSKFGSDSNVMGALSLVLASKFASINLT